jgi:hypothetical protein
MRRAAFGTDVVVRDIRSTGSPRSTLGSIPRASLGSNIISTIELFAKNGAGLGGRLRMSCGVFLRPVMILFCLCKQRLEAFVNLSQFPENRNKQN